MAESAPFSATGEIAIVANRPKLKNRKGSQKNRPCWASGVLDLRMRCPWEAKAGWLLWLDMVSSQCPGSAWSSRDDRRSRGERPATGSLRSCCMLLVYRSAVRVSSSISGLVRKGSRAPFLTSSSLATQTTRSLDGVERAPYDQEAGARSNKFSARLSIAETRHRHVRSAAGQISLRARTVPTL